MKYFTKIGMAALMIVAFLGSAWATEYTRGVVRKVDITAAKVTIAHEALLNLEMPAMTMVFRVADGVMLDSMKQGDEIEFVADRLNGKLTVMEVK